MRSLHSGRFSPTALASLLLAVCPAQARAEWDCATATASAEGLTTGTPLSLEARTWIVDGRTYVARWGSLHSHTGLSDGSGTPAQAFAHARGIAQMDFWGVSDHVAGPPGTPQSLTEEGWEQLKSEADAANSPGQFVTFYGYEWSPFGEHMVLWNEPDLLVTRDILRFLAQCGERGRLVNLSHLWNGQVPFWWAEAHPVYRPDWDQVFGLADVWAGGPYRPVYDELISQGYRVGAFAGQDNHGPDWGLIGEANGWGVAWSEELTRESIDRAFRACRTYATRDRDLVITYSLRGLPDRNGERVYPMGSTVLVPITFPLVASVEVRQAAGGEPIDAVEVLRNGVQIDVVFTDAGAFALDIPMGTADLGRHAYYLRLWRLGDDRPIAVTSPIWVGGWSQNSFGYLGT